MAGPWEKYGQQAAQAQPPASDGPWSKYGASPIVAGSQGIDDGDDGRPPLEIEIVGGIPESLARAGQGAVQKQVMPPPAAPDGWEYGAGRDAAFGARSLIQGTGSLIGAVGGDAFNNYIANPIARQLGMQEARPYREEAAALADRIGLPKAQTSGDRILGDVGEALTGTGLTLGIGAGINALARLAPRAAQAGVSPALRGAAPVAENRLAQLLTAQPGLQTASSAAGAGAASATREVGGSPSAQLGAGLVGGFSPGAASGVANLLTGGRVAATGTVPALTAGAARRGLRGTDNSVIQRRVDEFAAAGTTPSVGQATGSRSAQALETYLGNSPGGSGRIARLGGEQADAAKATTDRLSNQITPGGADLTPTQVGTTVQQGIYGPNGFVDRTKAVSDRLYAELDKHLPAETMIPVSNTAKAMRQVNGSISGAPEISRIFDQPRLRAMEGALLSDSTGGAAVLTQPGMRENAGAYRQYLQQQAQAIAANNARRRSLGMTVMEPVPSAADIEENVRRTVGNMADGTLPYQAIKELRSKVGQEVGATFLTRDAAHGEWKKLYSALTADMESAASSPEAKRALSRANNYYKLRQMKLEQIGKIVQKEGGPEVAYQAMFAGAKNGATPLKRVMDALPPSAREDVTASFLQRMGRATKANQNAAGDAFSMETFLSNWADLSPEARKQLFSNARFGSDYVQNVSKLANVAEAIRTGGKVFANPPGTARQAALGVTLGGTALMSGQQALQGNLGQAAIVLASSLGLAGSNNLLARMMTNPQTVRWLAKNTERNTGDIQAQLNGLRQIGEKEDDDEVAELANRLESEVGQARQPPKNFRTE